MHSASLTHFPVQTFERGNTWDENVTGAHFLHERLNQGDAIVGGECERQEPGRHFTVDLGRKRAEAIDPLQFSQVFKSCGLAALRVLHQAEGIHAELICQVCQKAR